jgi:hypothetical protein
VISTVLRWTSALTTTPVIVKSLGAAASSLDFP